MTAVDGTVSDLHLHHHTDEVAASQRWSCSPLPPFESVWIHLEAFVTMLNRCGNLLDKQENCTPRLKIAVILVGCSEQAMSSTFAAAAAATRDGAGGGARGSSDVGSAINDGGDAVEWLSHLDGTGVSDGIYTYDMRPQAIGDALGCVHARFLTWRARAESDVTFKDAVEVPWIYTFYLQHIIFTTFDL
jgi:hypothetical protein